MRRHAKLAEGPVIALAADAADATDAASAWVESNQRLVAGLLELNTQAWAGWFALQQTCWQQAQAMLEEMPLWMSWQFGTEQLA